MNIENKASSDELKYDGVEGWLFLLCLDLVLISPLFILLFEPISFFHQIEVSGLVNHAKPLTTEISFWLIWGVQVLLMFFGIYCGRLLWKKNPKGVQLTKNYFLLKIAFVAVFFFAFTTRIFSQETIQAIRLLIIYAIWYSYLNNSKRVKATYKLAS